MKVKQLNERALKIIIEEEDLIGYDIDIADFLPVQDKAEAFFYSLLEEVEVPDAFHEPGVLSFHMTPKTDRIEIVVTKGDLPIDEDGLDDSDKPTVNFQEGFGVGEYIKMIGEMMHHGKLVSQGNQEIEQAHEPQTPSEIQFVVAVFDSLEALAEFSHDFLEPLRDSELYKYDGHYYLALLLEAETPEGLAVLRGRVVEYARPSSISRSVLVEHGVRMIDESALERLRKVPVL